MRCDVMKLQIGNHGDDANGRKRSCEELNQARLDLQHDLSDALLRIGDHAGVQDLIAEALLTPNQQRSDNPFTTPARPWKVDLPIPGKKSVLEMLPPLRETSDAQEY